MDSTPGLEVYESYETDYKQIAASVGSKLKGEVRDTKGGERNDDSSDDKTSIHQDSEMRYCMIPQKRERPSYAGSRWSSKRQTRLCVDIRFRSGWIIWILMMHTDRADGRRGPVCPARTQDKAPGQAT